MANDIKNHGQYGQNFSWIWPQYGHFFNEFWPYFQYLLHFYVIIFAKISNWERNFTKCFLKNFQSAWFLPNEENLKILRWKLLEKFVLCHRLSWVLNWKVKFGQNSPKNNQKWPEMSKFFPKAKYGHICHEKKWPWTNKFHGQGNLWPQLGTLKRDRFWNATFYQILHKTEKIGSRDHSRGSAVFNY